MRVRLIGGDGDGEFWEVPDDHCDPGETIRTYHCRKSVTTALIDPNVAGPDSVEAYESFYRIATVHLDKDRYVIYGHHISMTPRDALVALFGQPRWN
jgi:hypothetical protein